MTDSTCDSHVRCCDEQHSAAAGGDRRPVGVKEAPLAHEQARGARPTGERMPRHDHSVFGHEDLKGKTRTGENGTQQT